MEKSSIAIGIILLVISMPMNSSIVLARILKTETYGSQGFVDSLSQTDTLEYLVYLDDPANRNEVRTDFPENTGFDECYLEEEEYKCRLKITEKDWSGGSYSYTISLFDSDALIDSKTGSFNVDDTSPSIDSFTVNQNHENITFSYQITDTACSGCSGCIGLSDVKVMEEHTELWSENLDSCAASGSGSIDAELLSVVEGNTRICIEATDRGGKTSERVCNTISVDSSGPEINSFGIVDMNGHDLRYVSTIPINARAIVNVSESELKSVKGDFHAFNSVAPEVYSDLTAQCEQTGETHLCTFDLIIDGVTDTVTADVFAEDVNGNIVSLTKAFSFTKTEERPLIIGLWQTNLEQGEILSLHRGENLLTLELASTGASFYNKDVYIDMTRFGGARIKADSCEVNGTWNCNFRTAVTKSNGYRNTIIASAINDLGIRGEEERGFPAVVDTQIPIIEEVTLSSECALASQGLTVDVLASDDLPMTMIVDASAVTTLTEPIYGDCDDYGCTITVFDLLTEYTRGNLQITISDAAGNEVTRYQLVEICEEDSSAEPNLVNVVIGTPTPVDKRLLSFIDAQTFVPVRFEVMGTARIISKEAYCKDAKSSYFINSLGTAPSLVLKLKKQTVTNSTLDVECEFRMTIRKGRKVFSMPQVEKINITVPMFSNALGEISTTMQTKIDGVTADIDDLEDDIDKWEKYNKWLNMLCSTAETMGKMSSVLEGIKELIWIVLTVVHVACNALNVGESACKGAVVAIWNPVCEGVGSLTGIVEKYVWPTGYTSSGDNAIGNIVKYGCMLYSCRICDWSTVLDIGTSIAAARIGDTKVHNTEMDFANGGNIFDTSDGPETGSAGSFSYSATSSPDNPNLVTLTTTEQLSYGDSWDRATQKTYVKFEPDSSTWIFDPYRSIHYAKACLCLPGYLYNLRKERQIKCMYKTCLEEHAKVGLPTGSCDFAYKERECLYVDSAQYKEHGYMGGFLDNLWDTLIANLPGIVLGLTYAAACAEYRTNSGVYCDAQQSIGPMYSSRNVICSLMGAAIRIVDIVDFFDGGMDFSQYDAELEGTDFCSGGA